MRAATLGAALLAAIALPFAAQADPPDGVEMEFLWHVNHARSDPAAWGAEHGLGAILAAIAPQPPLAINATLVDSAQAKAQEFIDHDYFAHDSPVTGSPNALIVNVFDYPLAANTGFFFGPDCAPCVYGGFGNTGLESLAASFGPTGGNFATAEQAVRGLLGEICDVAGTPNTCGTTLHRLHLLGAAPLTRFMVEFGAGHTTQVEGAPATTTHYWVLHTGLPAGTLETLPQYLTGVVYADADGDERYDAGEGRGGVNVQVNSFTTTSNAAGGWSIAVPNGSYDVSCSGGTFAGTASAADVEVADASHQIDCISGESAAVVDFAPEADASLAGLVALCALARVRRSRG